MSELLPHLGSVVDDIALIRSMCTDQFNHAPAELLLHTGSPRSGGAAMGSWVTYGLGSENQNLPGFVVLISGGTDPNGGKSAWGSGFLPSVFQGVQCRTSGEPILFVTDPTGMARDVAPPQPRRPPATERDRSRRIRRSGNGHAHQPVRAGFPHADVGPRGDGHCAASRPDTLELMAPSRAQTALPTTACWPAGWSSRACATCSFSTGAGTSTAPAANNDLDHGTAGKVPRDRPANRGPDRGPEAARHARRHAGRLGRRIRPHVDERRRAAARKLLGPRPSSPTASPSGWPAAASREACHSAKPTTSATSSRRTR